MACVEKIVPIFYSALDVFFQLWKNLIFTAFSSTRHQFNSSKIFQLRSTTRAGTMNGATPRSRVKSWTGCAKNFIIYHYSLSISIIRLCKEGKIDGPHFCKNQVPLIWQKIGTGPYWSFWRRKNLLLCHNWFSSYVWLCQSVSSQIFVGRRW